MNRREFLKLLGAGVLGLLLPKRAQVEKEPLKESVIIDGGDYTEIARSPTPCPAYNDTPPAKTSTGERWCLSLTDGRVYVSDNLDTDNVTWIPFGDVKESEWATKARIHLGSLDCDTHWEVVEPDDRCVLYSEDVA